MPALLDSVPLNDAQRIANDRHRPVVVVVVLAVLLIYIYLFTLAADDVGAPSPKKLARQLDISAQHIFDSDGNVDSNVGILMAQKFKKNDDERLVFLLILVAAFLCVYFMPLRYKQASLVFWTLLALLLLYGKKATAGLVCAHLIVYLVLHPKKESFHLLCLVVGITAYLAFVHKYANNVFRVVSVLGLPVLSILVYRFGVLRLLENKTTATLLRNGVIHSAILAICISVLLDAMGETAWKLPLGLLLFFWQWARLTMYHIDYKDGHIPEDLSLDRYLAVFLSPGTIPNWSWGVTIPQGFAYLNNNFFCEDKNKIVLDGAKLLGIALVYLVFWNWFHHFFVAFFTSLDIEVYRGYTKQMVRQFVRGHEVAPVSVWTTTLLDLIRFMMFFAGVVHFKVGIWRICGYRVAPYYNRPWLATNLMTFWTRFAFHYREFLVRTFYYPVFFQFFKRHPNIRIFAASMAAAAIGNMIWHFTERVFFREMDIDNIEYVLGTWPYFFFLGLGIAVSQWYLMRRKSARKPWSWDRWIVGDIIAAYATLQFFALIHVFARPVSGSTVWDLFRLFFSAFGVDLKG